MKKIFVILLADDDSNIYVKCNHEGKIEVFNSEADGNTFLGYYKATSESQSILITIAELIYKLNPLFFKTTEEDLKSLIAQPVQQVYLNCPTINTGYYAILILANKLKPLLETAYLATPMVSWSVKD